MELGGNYNGRVKVLLVNELTRRIQRNPRYSLRAFATNLGISHSLLSLVLTGKRRASKKLIDKLTSRLSFSPEEIDYLYQKEPEEMLAENSIEYKKISLDSFAVLSDWYHYAILSLLEIPGSTLNSKWIARRLNISMAQARLAIERLKRLKLIAKQNGRWRQCTEPLKVENKISTSATRKHHKQLLQKSEEALESSSFEERDFSAMTFAMDPKLVPYARQRIRNFRRKLVADLEKMAEPSEVYQLTVQIYPITRKDES